MKTGASPITLDFPFPPSANSIWRSRRGRRGGKPSFYLSKHYADWKLFCDALIMATRPRPKIRGPFAATITLSNKKRRKNADADNRVKPTLDMLQRAGVIENDSLAQRVTVQWGEAPEGCRVLLEPVTPIVSVEGR